MNKTVHILNCQLRPTSSVAINVEKHIAINLHYGDIQCMNVGRNHNSDVLTVHTRPRETVIFSVTSDLNFLVDTSMLNHLYVNVNILFFYSVKYCCHEIWGFHGTEYEDYSLPLKHWFPSAKWVMLLHGGVSKIPKKTAVIFPEGVITLQFMNFLVICWNLGGEGSVVQAVCILGSR
jgi:hypothetical protein